MKQVLRSFLLIAMMALSAGMALADNEFCWRDSEPRGVGTIPTGCAAGEENQAGLCYSACKPGFTGVGPVCWSGCPPGYSDNGAVCHIDKPLTRNPEWVCTAWWPGWLGGECRWKDTRCPDDYTNVGLFCALNSAGKSAPAGYSGTYLDPMKNSYGRGAGTIPIGCAAGEENDAGLCYKTCKAGYTGLGPVCWAKSPPTWVECGMGSAKSSSACGSVVFGQVGSVFQLTATVASLGSSTALTAGMSAPQKASRLAKLKQDFTALQTAYDVLKSKNIYVAGAEASFKAVNAGRKGYVAFETGVDAMTEEDMVRMAAQIAAIADPSGISDTIASYTYPKCSKYFGIAGSSSSPVALNWVASTGTLAANAVIGGTENTRALAVCQTSYQGGTHPGKVVAGKCNIGWGGKEVTQSQFNVLINNGANLDWVSGPIADGMVIGGQENGKSLAVCRASYNGGVHPGKVVAGNCNIGWGGKEIVLTKFEVLVQRK